MLEKKNAGKGYPNQGWARKARTAKRVYQNHGKRENGIKMAMINKPCDCTWKRVAIKLRQHAH